MKYVEKDLTIIFHTDVNKVTWTDRNGREYALGDMPNLSSPEAFQEKMGEYLDEINATLVEDTDVVNFHPIMWNNDKFKSIYDHIVSEKEDN